MTSQENETNEPGFHTSYQRRLGLISKNFSVLNRCLHGVERECLRVTSEGGLARTPHPYTLGSALAHDQITTDYSESLLEFITTPQADPARMLENLDEIQRFVYNKLDDEFLWSSSMPCVLPAEEDIPIAAYGTSNMGRLKHVYRKGLALRYGRSMQCIAGIHYNFSLPEELWPLLQEAGAESICDFQSSAYLALIRNFHRYNWLLMYLFGASPALDKNFLGNRPHQLKELDPETLYLPYATSLRMSDLGYQSSAQAHIKVDYNSFSSYIEAIRAAVCTPYPTYIEAGTRNKGEWVQLSTSILQIENEYYSRIRPKRTTSAGERPLQALMARGVEYVEVRCLDINPFLPLGIDLDEALFLDTFLLFCALQESPLLSNEENDQCTSNFHSVVTEGRRPGLELRRGGQPIALKSWANELIEHLVPLVELLDRARGGNEYTEALVAQQAKVNDAALTPSAQVLKSMAERNETFVQFGLRQSYRHAGTLRGRPLNPIRQQAFEDLALESQKKQSLLEREDSLDFDLFVEKYHALMRN